MNQEKLPPAQLWLGSHDELTDHVISFLQKRFCTDTGCGVCITCQQIREQQHHAVVWVYPEKQYTLETLRLVQERLPFALDGQECFFILQKADFLTKQCANSLLKSIEEPPPGYYFILCAQRLEYILPTIQSRCMVHSFATSATLSEHKALYDYFTDQHQQHPLAFLKELQKSSITEQQSLELIDQLLAFWMQEHKKKLLEKRDSNYTSLRVTLCKKALLQPPMPGSSKLFWKNLYLQWQTELHRKIVK